MHKFEENLGGLLSKSTRLLQNTLSRKITESQIDITTEQWVLLNEIKRYQPVSPLKLSQSLVKNKGSITSLIKGCEKQSLISKLADDKDKRSYRLILTEKGEMNRQACIPFAREILEHTTSDISESDLEITKNTLKRLIQKLAVDD